MITPQTVGGALPGLSLKAWALLNAASGALIKGFNVTSGAKGGTGVYLFTFTTAMATNTYLTRVTAMHTAGNIAGPMTVSANGNTTAVGQVYTAQAGVSVDALVFAEFYE